MFDVLSSCQVKEGLSSSGQVEFKHSRKDVSSREDNKSGKIGKGSSKGTKVGLERKEFSKPP